MRIPFFGSAELSLKLGFQPPFIFGKVWLFPLRARLLRMVQAYLPTHRGDSSNKTRHSTTQHNLSNHSPPPVSCSSSFPSRCYRRFTRHFTSFLYHSFIRHHRTPNSLTTCTTTVNGTR
ncbi:hypothetical protein TRVL_02034 [Trypanosoma vivax]|nr:hypothetical protein TRVL_02034 [Trypanosoma vivax]